MIDSSLVLFIAVVILIFFVVLYWLRMTLFLLDHGSNVSVIADEDSSIDSFFVAAVNKRDKGSTSTSWNFVDNGSVTKVDDATGVELVVCVLLV